MYLFIYSNPIFLNKEMVQEVGFEYTFFQLWIWNSTAQPRLFQE